MSSMQPAVFLDRDNTIIHNDGDLGDPAQVRLIQGAASAIASLKGLGYSIVVITNQGGVARGKYTEKDVQAVHERINELVRQTSGGSIDRFYYCPYHPEGTVEQYKREHPWRKPQPGMLTQAAQDMQIDMAQSWMVGDQMRDIEAGLAVKVRTVLLREDAEELTPLQIEQLGNAEVEPAPFEGRTEPHFSARSLIEAVRIIAQQRDPNAAERNKRGQADEARRRRDVTDRFRPDSADSSSNRGGSSRHRAAVSGPAPEPRPEARPEPRSPQQHVEPVARPVPPAPLPTAAPRPAPEATPPAPLVPPKAQAPSEVTAPVVDKPSPPPVSPAPPKPAAAPVEADDASSATSPSPVQSPATSTETTLRQILQELRSQRSETDDFSHLRVVAIVLQIIVVVCLAGGLWLGSEQIESFHRWIGAAICTQLAVIATLLFDR